MRYRTSWLWAAASCAAVLLVIAGRAAALSPGFTFQGQLQDGSGPRNGTCDFRFSLFGVASGGAQAGSTQEMASVAVQNGLFTVTLNAAGEFGPTAFNGVDRWLEIAVRCPAGSGSFSAPFSPRQALTAVPYALYVPPQPPAATRFTDNGDGTVTDHTSGLMWEKKTGTVGSAVSCATNTCADPRNVNYRYEWCRNEAPYDGACDNQGLFAGGSPPDGGAFGDFLARTNGMLCTSTTCTGLGGHTDWRIPTIGELKTIVSSPCPGSPEPCIDLIFGPTVSTYYWSSTTHAGDPRNAWTVRFDAGGTYFDYKTNGKAVRAVRGGL